MGQDAANLLPGLPVEPAVRRTVRASEAAATLGFGKRALNHWCTKGVGGDVCPSEMRRVGRQQFRYVNLEEVRAWRRRVGLEDDRLSLLNQAAEPPPASVTPVHASTPTVVGPDREPETSDDLDDVDAMLAMTRDMMRQLREQVARVAQQDSDKISPAAIEKATGAAKKIGEELRALDKVEQARRDRLNLVITRIEAAAAVRSVGQVLTAGLDTLATDLPALLRSRLTEAAAIDVKDQMVFDRIAAVVLRDRCEQVRVRLAGELEIAAAEAEGRERPEGLGREAA